MILKIKKKGLKEKALEPKDNLSKEAIKNPLQQKKKSEKNVTALWKMKLSFMRNKYQTEIFNQISIVLSIIFSRGFA